MSYGSQQSQNLDTNDRPFVNNLVCIHVTFTKVVLCSWIPEVGGPGFIFHG